MSFSLDIKTELCRVSVKRDCCALAEIYGILLLCRSFRPDEIRVVTSCELVARRARTLLVRAFGVPEALPELTKRRVMWSLALTDGAALADIFKRLGYDPDSHLALHLNSWIMERDCCRGAFLRGAFLSGGFAVEPSEKYRLELVTPHAYFARELMVFLSDSELRPRMTERGGNCVVYLKESEGLSDFLTLAGAPVSAMRVMDACALKSLRNDVNRRVNSEVANISKSAEAAASQLEAIELLTASGALETLPLELRIVAKLRADNPEASLSELAAAGEIGRSAVNRRLCKLVALAEDARKNGSEIE